MVALAVVCRCVQFCQIEIIKTVIFVEKSLARSINLLWQTQSSTTIWSTILCKIIIAKNMFQSSFINTIIFVAFQIITLAPCCVHAGWIDRDTPSNVRTIYSYYDVEKIESSVKKHHKENNTKWEFHLNKAKENKKRRFQLVFSDEFNTVGRSFSNGQDSRWTSLEKNDYTNDALHYYRWVSEWMSKWMNEWIILCC